MNQAILLVGFGGPTKPAEVRPFLDNVLRGRPVSKERYEEVVRQYERIGGASPFNALSRAFAQDLQKAADLPVFVGMRNWEPYVGDVMARMKADGVREAAVIVLSSFRSEPSWDRYVDLVREKNPGLELKFVEPWSDEDRFIEAVADRARAFSAEDRAGARHFFTAHSIPVELARASGYSEQLERCARRVAAALGAEDWKLVFQSRSGRSGDAWLEPDVSEALRAYGAEGGRTIVVIPLGFLVDHVEVLFDLDVKARAAAEEAGLRFLRAKTVGDHPAFVALLAERARTAFGASVRP